MKNLSQKIIVSLIMLAIFLAPVSGGIKIEDKHLTVKIEKNEALAINVTDIFSTSTLSVVSTNSNSAMISGVLIVNADKSQGAAGVIAAYDKVAIDSPNGPKAIYFIVKDNSGKELGKIPFARLQTISPTLLNTPFKIDTKNITGDFAKPLLLTPNTTYNVFLHVEGTATNGSWETSKPFTTTAAGDNAPTNNFNGINQGGEAYGQSDFSLGCSLNPVSPNLMGCVAEIFYTFWTVSAQFARLAGSFLDFFVYYSTNSSSYNNDFVKLAWAAVRDIANIFFIIALLYVAIKTILGLNVTDNKKLISAVVVIALIINFSLFTTELIIDGSNILAKVFYNNITSKDANAPKNADGTLQDSTAGAGGQKSISVGIIDKFNPQGILTIASYKTMGVGIFIFITFLLIAITLYTAYIFFSVALLFVARVISLWLSMIFSPIAFISYALPFKISGFGKEDWWPDLIKNALLAPIFVFFLYIIILFTGFLTKIVNYTDNPDLSSTANLMQHLMSVVIPFVIIFMLLKKAKEFAVEYSGKMGQAVVSGTKMLGGFALGAGVGGLAMLGRNAIGAGSSVLLRSGLGEKLRTKAEEKGLTGFTARMALKGTTSATKSSFDLRKTKLGGGLSKATGMNFESANIIGLGSKTGGFQGIIEKRNKENLEEFETHKTKMTNDEVEKWNQERKTKGKGLTNPDGSDIKTAEQLNNYRMKKFNDNIGKTGLVYSTAYSTAKGALKTKQRAFGGVEASDEDIQKAAKSIKMGIGIALSAVGGGLGAGVGAGMFGTAGGIVGGSIGAAQIPMEHAKEEESERLTRATMKKQIDTLKALDTRIQNLTKAETEQLDFLKNSEFKDFVKGDEKQGFSIEQDKVENALSKLVIDEREKNARFMELAKNGKEIPEDLREDLRKTTKQITNLNKLRTGIKDLNTIQNQLYNVKKDKTTATTPAKKEESGGGPKPAATPPPSAHK